MHVLIAIQPLNLSTGARETVRVASAQDRRLTGLDGQVWVPALVQSPVLAIRLFDGDFSSSVEPGSASFVINLGEVGQTYANAYAYLWAGAPVSIYAEEPGTAWPWTRRFVGKVRQFEKDGKRLQLVAEVDTAALEKDVLYLKYAGTTGLEGGADLKDRVRPWVWGHVKGIEPIQIDIDNSVFQVSGYGAIGGIPEIYERGSSFGASMGNYANYAALVAATIPPGRWATCVAQGLFRLGAPPFGVITADVRGHLVGGSVPRRTGAIINAMAAALGISSDSINSASLDALDAAVPRNINAYLTEQVTFIDLARQLCLPCNAYSGMSWEGKFFAVRPVFDSVALTLHGQGRADPPVLKIIEGGVNPPFKKTIFGADRCWRVHTTNEIAYQDILVDRGRYQPGETYRPGNIVDLADGSRWLYTADTASSGNAPSAGSAFWTLISDQVEPLYDDGTPMRDLQPAEAEATKGAIIPTPGSGVPTNVRDELGVVRNSGEMLNSEIRLDPAGRLTYRPLPDVPPVELGQISLPDLGAVSEAALRRAEDDIDQMARALAAALDEASTTRATFRDAGFYVDAATGQVRIHAIEQTKERVSTAEIRLNAAEASILLRATNSYVNEQIALAVIDPSQIAELEEIFLRIGAAEVDIDGLNATVTTLATVTELSLVQGRVTTAEEAIDALEGTITTKVDTTTFDALATRVTNAETVLTAIGDTASIVNAVSATRLIEKAQDGNAEQDLRALLQGDRTKREQVAAIAAARQELTARIIDGDTAEAAFRLALQVRVGAAEASLATESITRANADSALASQITSLSASTTSSVNALSANIAAETTARTNAVSALATDITNLSASVTTQIGAEATARNAAIAAEASNRATAINNEANARIAAIQSEASARGTAITAEQQARINAINAERQQTLADVAAEALARQQAVTTLTASVNAANQARVDGDNALASSITTLNAELDTEVSNRAAAVDNEAQARIDGDGLIAAGLAQQVTAGRVVEGLASDLADQLLRALLTNDKNRREVNGAVAAARQEITAQVVSATEAFATSILALVARIANNEASFINEQIARATADESIVASVTQLEAQVETEVATLSTSIINEQIARADAVQSLATSITNLNASFTGQLSAEATARTSAIAAEATTRAQAISAEAETRNSAVNTLTNGLNNTIGRLTDEELARLQGDQAEATARTAALAAEASARATAINNEANARIAAIQAEADARGTALTAEENARIAAINAERTQTLADVAAERTAREQAVTTLTASISNEAIARANGDGALAGQINTLNTTVAGQSATLTTFGESINGLRARWGVRLDNNGRITGFVLNGSDTQGNADFVVDRFRLIHPTSGFVYFQATETGVLMSNVEVDTLKAGIVSASRMSGAAMGETAYGYAEPAVATNGFNWISVASVSMTPVNGRPTKLLFSALIRNITDANTVIKVRIIRDDGAVIYGESPRRTGAHLNITDEGVPVCIPIVDNIAAGRATTWTFQMAKVIEQTVICEASFRFAQAEELSRVNTQASSIVLGGGEGGGPGPGVPITNPPGGSNPIP